MNREELLATIRRIVGNKTFEFSKAYVKKCGKYPTLGEEDRQYTALTKKYLYINCRVTYGWNADETERGPFFHPYSLYRGVGEEVRRVELKQLFTKDLLKIYNDLLFYLWWEKSVRLPKIENEYIECKKYADIFDKIEISEGDMEKIKNR
jgi:hypothetical protein